MKFEKYIKVIILILAVFQAFYGLSAANLKFTTTLLVNTAPTLDPIPDQGPFPINSSSQTIQLTGITDGGMGEKQVLFVTAVSSNTALVPHPVVNYTSPDASGLLTLTPVKDAHGTASITVTVSDGEDTFSRTFKITVSPPVVNPPAAPVATAATTVTQTSFTANWNSVSGATSYQLDVSTNAGFSSYLAGHENLTVNSTSKTITGLDPNTKYFYRVRAVNSDGTSPNSNSTDVTTSPVNKPAAPVATAATTVTQTSFTANWNSVSGATSYQLDVS
ncbi:MAG: fibronectin type III domain-containing protein, partial [Bacteroidota bacterium]|nr:fibronectin type III domain-containing protein [Bacteroidota bacterium]